MTLPHRGAALILALALLAVSGCGGDEEKPKASPTTTSATPSASASATGVPPVPELSPGVPGNPGLPEDFPGDEVPLLDGLVELPLGPGSGEEGRKGWVLQLTLAQSSDACFEEAARVLTENGFTQQPGETKDETVREALFTAPGYAVIISASRSDDGGCRLSYEVGQVPEDAAQ